MSIQFLLIDLPTITFLLKAHYSMGQFFERLQQQGIKLVLAQDDWFYLGENTMGVDEDQLGSFIDAFIEDGAVLLDGEAIEKFVRGELIVGLWSLLQQVINPQDPLKGLLLQEHYLRIFQLRFVGPGILLAAGDQIEAISLSSILALTSNSAYMRQQLEGIISDSSHDITSATSTEAITEALDQVLELLEINHQDLERLAEESARETQPPSIAQAHDTTSTLESQSERRRRRRDLEGEGLFGLFLLAVAFLYAQQILKNSGPSDQDVPEANVLNDVLSVPVKPAHDKFLGSHDDIDADDAETDHNIVLTGVRDRSEPETIATEALQPEALTESSARSTDLSFPHILQPSVPRSRAVSALTPTHFNKEEKQDDSVNDKTIETIALEIKDAEPDELPNVDVKTISLDDATNLKNTPPAGPSVDGGNDGPPAGPGVDGGNDAPPAGPSVEDGNDAPPAGPSVDDGNDIPPAGPSVDDGNDIPPAGPSVHDGNVTPPAGPSVNDGNDIPPVGPSVDDGNDAPPADPSVDDGNDAPPAGPSVDDGNDTPPAGPSVEGGNDHEGGAQTKDDSGSDSETNPNGGSDQIQKPLPTGSPTPKTADAVDDDQSPHLEEEEVSVIDVVDDIEPVWNPQPISSILFDFETDGSGNALMAGDIIDHEFQSYGVSITTHDPVHHPAMIFDTRQPTGNDFDLAVAPGIVDHVLIISEDADSSDPDDNVDGGTIQFTFDSLVGNVTVGVLDIDLGHSDGYVEALDNQGQILGRVAIPTTGNDQLGEIYLGVTGIAAINISLEGSGAITKLNYDVLAPDSSSLLQQGQGKSLL